MQCSEQINDIAAALAKAQGEVRGATKDALNDHFKRKYADLAAVWDACREPLTANGLSVIQPATNRDGRLCIVTRVIHATGQWIEDDGIPLLLGKQDMQALGSAITYARRYGLMAMVGIAPEDDDGEGAGAKGESKPVTAPEKTALPRDDAGQPTLENRYKTLSRALDAAKTVEQLASIWNRAENLRQQLNEQRPDLYNAISQAHDIIKDRLSPETPFDDKETA